MASGALVEQSRVLHADIERNTKKVIDIIAHCRPRSLKEEAARGQAIRQCLEVVASDSDALNKYYADDELLRTKDLHSLGGPPQDQEDETVLFSTFYDALKHLRELHRSGAVVVDQFDAGRKDTNTDFSSAEPVGFSGEEFYGRYVDLNSLHLKFMNLKRVAGKTGGKKRKRMQYLLYLKSFANFEDDSIVKNAAYVHYLKDLLQYFSDFHARVHPLYPVEKVHEELEKAFDEQIDQDQRLKLFCVACNKQFAKETVFNSHLSGKKHVKAAKQLMVARHESYSSVPESSIPLLEFKIFGFKELLKERVMATVQFVESMQTKTYDEILAERVYDQEEEEVEEEAGSDDDQVIYNPLKIPLGWDGKPIPYWLYKLHGLNIEYKCEICGNFSYWGPRAFDRHFNEWRHVNGLRSLGIPNTKAFKNITGIEDAMNLYQKLQYLDKKTVWKAENDEEFEDDEGNVFNKKTYDDLKRQGLL